MAWTVIDADRVLSRLSSAETAAARTVSLGVGQTDPLTYQIEDATNFARGYLSNQVTLEAAGVHPMVVGPTCAIIIYNLLLRVAPNLAELRKQAYLDALKFFEAIADKDVLVPEDETGTATSDPTPSIAGREITITPESTDGM